MSFVSKEIPAGAINGVNTVFTLDNNVSVLDDVFVDGAIYLGTITVLNDTITLADAPTVSIYVDYWTAVPTPPVVPTPLVISLQEAKDAVENIKRDISDVSTTVFLQWCNFAEQHLYKMLVKQAPERFIDTQTYSSVTSGSQAIPSDFKGMGVTGTGLFEVDQNGDVTDRQLVRTGYGSTLKGYYITGSSIVFTGINTATTYVLRYIPLLTKKTTLTEYFTIDGTSTGVATIPSEYMEALVADLCKIYDQWDDNAGAESLDDFRFVRCLNEMLGDFDQDVHVFATNPFTGAF